MNLQHVHNVIAEQERSNVKTIIAHLQLLFVVSIYTWLDGTRWETVNVFQVVCTFCTSAFGRLKIVKPSDYISSFLKFLAPKRN